MARTKKELKDQEPQLGSEIEDQAAAPGADATGLELGDKPDTASPSDLELMDGVPQAPNALQTEMDQGQEGGQLPQTGLELGMDPAGPGELPATLQTDPESAGEEALEPGGTQESSHTGPEPAEGTEGQAGETAVPQTGSEPAGDEAAGESGSAAPQTDSGQPKNRLRMPGRRGQRVVSIDAERTVETDTDKLRSDLLDLVESLKGKKILTGTIQGVERLADNPEMSYAVTYELCIGVYCAGRDDTVYYDSYVQDQGKTE